MPIHEYCGEHKETKEGQTHFENDRCGEPAHNMTPNNTNEHDRDFEMWMDETLYPPKRLAALYRWYHIKNDEYSIFKSSPQNENFIENIEQFVADTMYQSRQQGIREGLEKSKMIALKKCTEAEILVGVASAGVVSSIVEAIDTELKNI